MNILLVSNHNPHFTNTVVYRENALKKLGHQVIFFEDRDFLIPGRIRQKNSFLQKWDLKRLNRKMVETARKTEPDLCLMVGGFRILKESLLELKKMGVQTAIWTSDVPLDFTPVIETSPLYDHIFCAGTEAIEVLNKNGIHKAVWLPYACDPDYQKPIELTKKEKKQYSNDLVFIGAFYPNRWDILKELEDYNLRIWGPNWKMAVGADKKNIAVEDIKIDVKEWVKIYNASKIALVIHYQDRKTPSFQASPKVYEALACKCFVLVDRQKDIFSIFEDGKHLVSFKNINDLKKKIDYFLNHSKERKKIAAQGYQEVLKKHTYDHRIKKMFSIIHSQI